MIWEDLRRETLKSTRKSLNNQQKSHSQHKFFVKYEKERHPAVLIIVGDLAI